MPNEEKTVKSVGVRDMRRDKKLLKKNVRVWEND